MRYPSLLCLLVLGCDPFDQVSGYETIEGPLWDTELVAAEDGLYVRLPRAGRLVRVKTDGTYSEVELGGAEPTKLIEAPNGQVLAFTRRATCDDDDPKIKNVADCDEDDLDWTYSLDILQTGEITATADVPGHLDSLVFSDDGGTAVAYLDYDGSDLPTSGIVDLSEVRFIRLSDGTTQSVSVGFSPSNVLFSADGTKALVMSRSAATLVSLETFEKEVEYPLTLDPDQEIDPSGAQLTPDGQYALISIQGESDLYALDLEDPSIDMIELAGTPADLGIDVTTDTAVVVYGSRSEVDVLSNAALDADPETVDLDEPCTSVLTGDSFAVLYNDISETHDVYKLELDTMELTEFVMGNPVDSLELSDSLQYAVAVLSPEYSGSSGLEGYQDEHWGISILDMVVGGSVDLTLEYTPVGVEVVETDDGTWLLVLMEGLETVLLVDLDNTSNRVEVDLPAAPASIGAMPDGRFYITHDAPLGLVSFLDPSESDALESVHGFAALGLFEQTELDSSTED
ncbi:MAG: hypothetical protein QGG40_02645 [Myxococcota bacterium]|nr:hypothetical protein [Myxococcota bacterium]